MKVRQRNFRLSDPANRALEEEIARTGKSMTQVIEDHLLWQRMFRDDVQAVIRRLADQHKMAAPNPRSRDPEDGRGKGAPPF